MSLCYLCLFFPCCVEFSFERTSKRQLRGTIEEHICFSALLWYLGLGKLGKGSGILLGVFLNFLPALSWNTPCLALERFQALKSTNAEAVWTICWRRERRYCLRGKIQSGKEAHVTLRVGQDPCCSPERLSFKKKNVFNY